MNHVIESTSGVEKKIIITLDADEVNNHIDETIKDFGKTLALDGFRKGKVPTKVIEGKFPQEIQTRATDSLVNNNVTIVLEQEDINPISRIQFAAIEGNEDSSVKRGSPFKFAFTFEVLPEIKLPENLEELSIEVAEPDLDPKEVEALVHRIRQTGAKLVPVTENRLPKNGDVCLVDIEGTLDGKIVPGMKGENFHLQLQPEEKEAPSDVDKIVRTMKVGEEKTDAVVVPEDYPDPSFRGKSIDMKVKLHSLSLEELPPVDEELAKKFGFEDLSQLNKFVFESSMNSRVKKIKGEAQTKLLDSLLDTLDYELPLSMVATHKSEYLMEARNFLRQQGQEASEITEALKRMEDDAEREGRKQAKAQAFLLSLAFRDKITLSEKELNEYIARTAQESGQEPKALIDQLYSSGMISDIQERLLAAKTMDLIYSKAKKIVVDKNGNPVQAPDFSALLPEELRVGEAEKPAEVGE